MAKSKKEIQKLLAKFTNDYNKALSNLSSLSDEFQHLFDIEIDITMSTDGPVFISSDGEVGFVSDYINKL